MRNYLSLIIRYLKSKIRNPQDLKICNLKSVICNFQGLNICNPSGFTLIELAIVLVVVGLMVGLGAGMIGPMMKQYKYTQSRGTVDAAIASVISYAAGNRRIPNLTEFTSAVTESTDAFGKDLYYIADSNLYAASTDVCDRGTAVYKVSVDGNTIDNVAFVIVSGATNFNIQTDSASGTVNVYEQDLAGKDDCLDPNCPTVATAAQDPDDPDNYDDIVKWVTLNELKTKAGCLGAPLKILNNELPSESVSGGGAYAASIFADGGIPFAGGYGWCRQESASTGLTFSPTTLDTDCLTLPEGSWLQANSLDISGGPPSAAGSYRIIFFVRDNNDPAGTNDNIAQKTIVLTVSP